MCVLVCVEYVLRFFELKAVNKNTNLDRKIMFGPLKCFSSLKLENSAYHQQENNRKMLITTQDNFYADYFAICPRQRRAHNIKEF